jgi:hypothetical protein
LLLEKWGALSLNFERFYLFIMRYSRNDDFLQQGSYKITVIATAKTVRRLLMAETIDFIASSFFLLPSSFCYTLIPSKFFRYKA